MLCCTQNQRNNQGVFKIIDIQSPLLGLGSSVFSVAFCFPILLWRYLLFTCKTVKFLQFGKPFFQGFFDKRCFHQNNRSKTVKLFSCMHYQLYHTLAVLHHRIRLSYGRSPRLFQSVLKAAILRCPRHKEIFAK